MYMYVCKWSHILLPISDLSSNSISCPPLVDIISFMACLRAFAALGYGEEAERQFGLEVCSSIYSLTQPPFHY